MAQRRETARLGQFTAVGAMGMNLRVVRTAADHQVVQLADANDTAIGETLQIAYAAGDPMGVYDARAPGTHLYIANSAIAAGAEVFAAAAGKVDNAGTISLGTAETAAAADGDWIEVGPLGAINA